MANVIHQHSPVAMDTACIIMSDCSIKSISNDRCHDDDHQTTLDIYMYITSRFNSLMRLLYSTQ